ncbi:MAG: glyoxalase [Bacteroidetes bacterium MedPE-SWsnd-G2]|nr:MAG: glyoxalase [Bacteroidetes bacterium MedPE-SWsnd-G2]
MSHRTQQLQGIRPSIPSAILSDNMSKDERFQNATLRPIIKFQNDLFVEVFKNYITKYKSVFYDLSLPKKIAYIENAVQKNMKFRNSLKGMVIGQFTKEEYLYYITNSSALNKRMMNIVKERLVSQIQLFETPQPYLEAV